MLQLNRYPDHLSCCLNYSYLSNAVPTVSILSVGRKINILYILIVYADINRVFATRQGFGQFKANPFSVLARHPFLYIDLGPIVKLAFPLSLTNKGIL